MSASSSPVSSGDKEVSSPGSPANSISPQNTSALALATSSAIIDSQVSSKPDLGGKLSSTIRSSEPTIPSENASAIAQTKSSAIIETPTAGSPDLGQLGVDVKVQGVVVSETQEVLTVVSAAVVDTPNKPAEEATNLVHPISPIAGGDSWVDLFKGTAKSLSKKDKAFVLPSGETCVKIPNSIIEKNMKAWESFIIGQFYADPPPQALIHTNVNGIWSRQFKDVSVSRLEGNAFLFRIPNSQTRRRVLNQRLWKIEGQTMFVANWEPGMVPVKLELTSAPI